MASVQEIFESRVGSSRGISGQSLTRSFLVTVDHDTDDPLTVIYNEFPIGSIPPTTFPDGFTKPFHWPPLSFVSGATIVRRVNHLVYEVSLSYSQPSNQLLTTDSAIEGWELSMRSVSESVQTFIQTNGKPMGQRIYKDVTSDPNNTSTTFAKIRNKTIKLELVGNDEDRITEPINLDVNGAAITLRREIPAFNIGVAGFLASVRNRTNSLGFLGAPRGFIRFTDFDISPAPAGNPLRTVETGNTLGLGRNQISGLAYNVSLSFLWSSVQMQPRRIHPTWIDNETGDRVLIQETVGPTTRFVEDSLDIYFETDMNALLSMVVNS